MFQFPALAPEMIRWRVFNTPGCPIRKSPDQRLFAPPRSLSQLITSFIASESQGIRHAPFFTFLIHSPTLACQRDDIPSGYRVVPFGNPRIKGHLHLPAAYRSLSRPSSPPRAKASAMCPYLLFVLPITYGRYILSAFNFTFFWSHHVKERCFNYKTIIKTEWRITDSNR